MIAHRSTRCGPGGIDPSPRDHLNWANEASTQRPSDRAHQSAWRSEVHAVQETDDEKVKGGETSIDVPNVSPAKRGMQHLSILPGG